VNAFECNAEKIIVIETLWIILSQMMLFMRFHVELTLSLLRVVLRNAREQ
jgi:hypothetical protein